MRTTLVIPDPVYERVRRLAAHQGTTISRVVTSALDALVSEQEGTAAQRPPIQLPTHDLGTPLVDIDDRDALYRAMEE